MNLQEAIEKLNHYGFVFNQYDQLLSDGTIMILWGGRCGSDAGGIRVLNDPFTLYQQHDSSYIMKIHSFNFNLLKSGPLDELIKWLINAPTERWSLEKYDCDTTEA